MARVLAAAVVTGALGAVVVQTCVAAQRARVYAQAVNLTYVLSNNSNAYESDVLGPAFDKAKHACRGASAATPKQWTTFDLDLDSVLREAHDVLPFTYFAASVAALPAKPRPLARLSALYNQEVTLLDRITPPADEQQPLSTICEAYAQWKTHGWSDYWLQRILQRIAPIDHAAAVRIQDAAASLNGALQRTGATLPQALTLTGVTFAFG